MSKVNIEAQKERHKKLFEGNYHTLPGRIWFHSKRGLVKLVRFMWSILPSGRRFSQFTHPLDKMPAPRRLYTQVALFGMGLLVLNSINISSANFEGGEGVGNEYLALDSTESYISDEEGYTIKNMPLEGETTFNQNRTERTEYTVVEGDTLSVIAYRYGLSTTTIRYANTTLGGGDYLKVGQTLVIPPKDGIYVKIESGSTLVSLTDKYKGDLDKTKEFNALEDDSQLLAENEIFIVGGRPIVVTVASNGSSSSGSSSSSGGGSYTTSEPTQKYYDIPASAEGWIRPTIGILTQGYHSGHYAYDIADRSKPPILAAASGTITYANGDGSYDGGYGNNVWIDHGNGYRTHYAHMQEIYVSEGETVVQGQAIGQMGATGRVYGVTGIHLHFELEYDGGKISPSVMGVW